VHSEVTLGSRSSFGFDGGQLVFREQLADAVRQLCAVTGPVSDAVALEFYAGWVGTGVVGTDHFNGTTVAGAVFLDNNNTIMGLLAGANARQTNHQHRGKSSQRNFMSFMVDHRAVDWNQHGRRTDMSPND